MSELNHEGRVKMTVGSEEAGLRSDTLKRSFFTRGKGNEHTKIWDSVLERTT